MPGASNLAILLFSTCSFYFCHPFRATTVFNDRQGHVTMSCKEPIEKHGNNKLALQHYGF